MTQGGCGNLCPSIGRGCYGCFGPKEGANTEALAAELAALGARSAHDPGPLRRLHRRRALPLPRRKDAAMT